MPGEKMWPHAHGPKQVAPVPHGPDGIAKVGHREYVGGAWDEIGQLQLDFLVSQGLEPEHVLLDIACGSLRAGVHLIPYLGSRPAARGVAQGMMRPRSGSGVAIWPAARPSARATSQT